MNANANNFWQYSVAFYREPGIAEACLKLQNQHGFDVNLVLFCIWHGLYRGLLPVTLLEQGKTLGIEQLDIFWLDFQATLVNLDRTLVIAGAIISHASAQEGIGIQELLLYSADFPTCLSSSIDALGQRNKSYLIKLDIISIFKTHFITHRILE
mgnify:CR=1 FL=1